MMRLAGISAAIHEAMADGQRAVGAAIDVPRSTLGDWGTDIRGWPADKLLALAAAYPEVRRAIVEAIDGSAPTARTGDATRDAFGLLVSGNKMLSGIANDLADGTMSPAEARARLPELREAANNLRRLILDAEAVAAVSQTVGLR